MNKTTKTPQLNQSSELATINDVVTDFFGGFIGEDRQNIGDNLTSTSVPNAQIINPTSPDPNGTYGIAIRAKVAKTNGFKPDENWEEITKYFADGSEEKMFISKKPRMLILNISEWLRTNNKVIEKSFFSNEPLPYGWHTFRYAIVMFVDKDNNFLSDKPFRLKASRTAGNIFLKKYKEFLQEHYKVFTQILLDMNEQKPVPENTYLSYHTNFVYCPEIKPGVSKSKDGTKQSNIINTVGFELPEGIVSYKQYTIARGSQEDARIMQFYEDTKDWLDVAQVNKEYKAVIDNSRRDNQNFVESFVSQDEIMTIDDDDEYVTMTNDKLPF